MSKTNKWFREIIYNNIQFLISKVEEKDLFLVLIEYKINNLIYEVIFEYETKEEQEKKFKEIDELECLMYYEQGLSSNN
jgi:hypothetical protein